MADYKATASELASVANAIRLKGGTSSALEYPSGWIAAIQELVPSSGGSELTPADPTAEYKVTDTELASIANTIRTRGGTQAQLEWPNGFISAIQAIPTPGPTIVPWSTGTDEEIAAMVSALDAGTLTIAETGWQIGDERQISLSAMEATGVSETHAAQVATLVLMDSQHYDLVGGGKDHFVVGLKDCLKEKGYISPNTTSDGSWDGSARRAWCNTVFLAAIPETIRACFKQFKCITAEEWNGSTNKISNDYFALFAEKEITGITGNSNDTEAGALSQIAYYATSSNRIKSVNGSAGTWWKRSPYRYNAFDWCNADSAGNSNRAGMSIKNGIAPFGCI